MGYCTYNVLRRVLGPLRGLLARVSGLVSTHLGGRNGRGEGKAVDGRGVVNEVPETNTITFLCFVSDMRFERLSGKKCSAF